MSYKTIKLKKYTDIINEYPAGLSATLLPGALVQLTPLGTLQNHSTAGGPAATLVPLEDELQGRTTRHAYTAGEPVQVWYVTPGEEALMLVDSAYDPAIGAYLQSAGN